MRPQELQSEIQKLRSAILQLQTQLGKTTIKAKQVNLQKQIAAKDKLVKVAKAILEKLVPKPIFKPTRSAFKNPPNYFGN